MKQKKAWRVYAERRKLRYKAGRIMDAPSIDGVIGDYTVSFFGSEHMGADARSARKLTAIEVNLKSIMPVGGGIASGGMVPVMKELNFRQEFLPAHKDWDTSYVATGENGNVLGAYLNDERLAALCKLMQIKNSWVILIFKDEAMLLRIDLPDPLHNPKRLDDVVKMMVEAARVLELASGETARLQAAESKPVSKQVEIELDEDEFGASSLQLEEDVDPEVADVKDVAGEPAKKEGAKDVKPSAPAKKSKKKAPKK